MTEPAVIKGHLVKINNVSTHKCGTLTIHVPEEETLDAIKKFGWPTMSHPVLVAVAMIDPNAQPERKGGKLAQRAGILCAEGGFQKFLTERINKPYCVVANADEAADYVRVKCEVKSRAELDHDVEAARKFNALEMEYKAWLTVPNEN